ncbi:MAG: EamA family transporter [Paracoccaceae bacterium]|nr:EamA family transporter [Paracoccaceae bacterium]
MPFLLLSGNINFSGVTWYEIVSMSILQGILNAVVALLLYSIAIRQIGTAQAGAFGALTPILALLGGAAFLDEAVTIVKTLGVVLVAFGVLMASRVFGRNH